MKTAAGSHPRAFTVAAAFMAGNAIVVQTQRHEVALGARACDDLRCRGVVSSPSRRLATLTDSVAAGKNVLAPAADTTVVVSPELGGKAPFIIEEVDMTSPRVFATVSGIEKAGGPKGRPGTRFRGRGSGCARSDSRLHQRHAVLSQLVPRGTGRRSSPCSACAHQFARADVSLPSRATLVAGLAGVGAAAWFVTPGASAYVVVFVSFRCHAGASDDSA